MKKSKSNKRRNKHNRPNYFAGILICGLLFITALIYIITYYARQKEAEEIYESFRAEDFIEEAPLEYPEETVSIQEETGSIYEALHKDNIIDFKQLWEINEDIYAWIDIPGTQVDYPVLQHPSDDIFYLDHTVEKAAGLPGSIYSESIHPKDFSAVQTILYGHNMKNDTMFGSLHDYEDEEFFRTYPYIYIYLPDRTMLYQIFAAVRFSDAYLPEYCDYANKEAFEKFVNELKTSSGQVNPDVEVSYGDRLLTLSTCIGNDAAHRFLVEAVLIDEYEK